MIRAFAIQDGALRPIPVESGVPAPAAALWIDLVHPSRAEEQAVEALAGVDIPTRAEAGGLQISDRLVAGDGTTLCLSALVPTGPDATPSFVPVTFIQAGKRLITVRYGAAESLDPMIARYSSGQVQLADAADLFAILLETVVDRIADQLEKIGETLDRIGHGIFRHPAALARRAGRPMPVTRRTHRLEATLEAIGQAHTLSARLRQSLQTLIRLVAFAHEHADDGLRRRLRAIEADLHSVAEHNTFLAAEMEFMLDATVGLIDIQQNKVIYILSIVSVALTPPVLVASTYGMNFHRMPELDWSYGYAFALALMLVSAIGPFLLFKLKGWL